MFSILQKPQDTVSAEDLETLQTELEKHLVKVVTKKWELDRELVALSSTSPDSTDPTQNPTSDTPNPVLRPASASGPFSGKLRNHHSDQQIDAADNSSDGFRSSVYGLGGLGCSETLSEPNSNEDSEGSDGSLASSLTRSTIITTLPDTGSQANGPTPSGTKRGNKSTNDCPSKRFRQNSNNSVGPSGVHKKRPPHSKHRSKLIPSKFRNFAEESRPYKKQVLRNEAPDKLWPFVDQFCATPTEEQITELQELIDSMDNDKDYFKIPVLGKKDACKDSPTKSDQQNPKNQRKTKSRSGDDEPSLGALTQRVLSSLVEESDEATSDQTKMSPDNAETGKKKSSKSKNNKSLDMNTAKNLERRIRQGLEDYDILDQQDDIPYSSEEDEILRELIATQHELLSIQRQNKDSMSRLLKKAKRHQTLENEREKLQEANRDVIASYYRLIQAKQRKRNPKKKEKDAAWSAIKVHESIFKRCDELYMAGLDRGKIP